MKTIICKHIDGHTIIIGFDQAVIDAANSKLLIEEESLDSPEYQGYLNSLQNGSEETKQTYWQSFLDKRREIAEESSVYFTPRAGEDFIGDEEAQSLKAQFDVLPAGMLLKRDGDLIEDQRGNVYWTLADGLWTKLIVSTLGENIPPEATLTVNLSLEQQADITEQLDQTRIDDLPEQDRLDEFELKDTDLKKQAVLSRMENELTGMAPAEALSASQAWYSAELADLQDKYGVIP